MITISMNLPLGVNNNKTNTVIKKGRDTYISSRTYNKVGKYFIISFGTIEYALKKRMILVSNVKSIYKSSGGKVDWGNV